MKKYDLISIGEVLIDFIPTGNSHEFSMNFGGAPANVAVAVARNSLDTAFCGMVGEDDFGRFIGQVFDREGVDFLCPDYCKEATTTLAFVNLDEFGDRSFTFARKPGADMFLSRDQLPEDQIGACRMINSGTLSMVGGQSKDTNIYALQEAHRQSKIVALDLNYRDQLWDYDVEACCKVFHEVLPYVDLLKISEEEVPMLKMPVTEAISKYGLTAVVVTLGPEGSLVHLPGDQVLKQEGIKAKVQDTTGAGDAFWGAFLASLLRTGCNRAGDLSESDFAEAMRCGAVSGFFCVQKKGAIESLPTYEELLVTREELGL